VGLVEGTCGVEKARHGFVVDLALLQVQLGAQLAQAPRLAATRRANRVVGCPPIEVARVQGKVVRHLEIDKYQLRFKRLDLILMGSFSVLG